MATEFLRVKTPDELTALLGSFGRLPALRAPLGDALGRVLATAVVSPEDLPDGDRSTMDGFAVWAEDTFGASDSLPLPLDVVGAVHMGERPGMELARGQAAHVPTGGYLPAGANAVVMKEHATLATESMVEIFRPVTAGENVLARGEDVRAGSAVLAAGRRIGPWDVGLVAALGITELEVGAVPRVRVLSTGDELVPIDVRPAPGQIRDANAHAVAALLRSHGCTVATGGIVADDELALRSALEEGLGHADLVVLSGGSSVGERDLMPAVVASLDGAEVLLHGVAIRPGKPTLVARVGDKAVIGLPGHPVSALVVAHVFVAPYVRYLAGEPMRRGPLGPRRRARLSTSIHSVRGREEFVRVRLEDDVAVPLFGKSSMLSSLTRADGLVVVPLRAEGIAKDEVVDVVLFAGEGRG